MPWKFLTIRIDLLAHFGFVVSISKHLCWFQKSLRRISRALGMRWGKINCRAEKWGKNISECGCHGPLRSEAALGTAQVDIQGFTVSRLYYSALIWFFLWLCWYSLPAILLNITGTGPFISFTKIWQVRMFYAVEFGFRIWAASLLLLGGLLNSIHHWSTALTVFSSKGPPLLGKWGEGMRCILWTKSSPDYVRTNFYWGI